MGQTTLRQSPSAFARHILGLNLHPGQVEWLDCRAKVKVACCGRRWGKTYSTAADLLWFAATRKETSQFVIAPTHDQAQIMFRYTERALRESPIAALTKKVVYSPFPEIQLLNDSVIRARSAGNDATNLRGHGADRVTMDEAAFIPPEVYETVSPLLATSPYGELVLISTPFGMNRFWEYWNRGQTDDPSVQSFRYPSESNPYLSRNYLEQQRCDMTALAYATEYLAEFHEDQAAVFPWRIIERCISGDLSDPQPGRRYVLGYDPAKFVDRSGVVILDVTQSPWQVVAIHDISGRDYEIQLADVERLAKAYNRASILMDSTHNEPLLEQLRKRSGVRVEGFNFTNASKQELINNLVIAMEQERVTFPHDRDLVTELTYYRYELTAAGNIKLGADEKHHDDLVTALALAAWQMSQPDGLPYAYLRNDSLFRKTTLEPETLTDEERAEARLRDYLAQ